MDWDLVLIFSFVIAIVLIVMPFAYLVNKRVQEHEERKLELEARIEEAKAAQAGKPSETHAHLEDRLRVLERIVTDPSADLSRQIEDLRELKMDAEKVR
ncbi:hypothetical protein [Aurantiacibacter sediminis]|uniref:Phage shock protein B n=1 Tax=Aurantiacibacter sediminis TaxID=2793064 RepID=A0ABS0N608_9SPHN|nr:hypothetical protein [Aurantiacibacter sediminis]MBH5323216.1 hypothetical protein [Aurantiacibacter sediminis]